MNIDGIIFDLDGTLLNTLEDLAGSMNMVLAECGFPTHPSADYLYFIGGGAKKLVERALPESERVPGRLEKHLARYRDIYRENWNVNTALYPGIKELLEALQSKNIPLGVLSNKPHSDLIKCVDYYFHDVNFRSIAGQKEGIPHKPAPDGVFAALKDLNIKGKNTLYVGDSSVDMQTAKAAGLIAVGVSWGFRTTEELLEHGADYILDKPEDLLSII